MVVLSVKSLAWISDLSFANDFSKEACLKLQQSNAVCCFYTAPETPVLPSSPQQPQFCASDCGSEALWFKSHEPCGIVQPWLAPKQNWENYGSSGKGWDHTAKLYPLHRCVFESVALMIWPTLHVLQFPGLVNRGTIMTVSVVCGPCQTKMDLHSIIGYHPHPSLYKNRIVSASVALHARQSWWHQSCLLPCLRQFWSKPSTSESPHRRIGGEM